MKVWSSWECPNCGREHEDPTDVFETTCYCGQVIMLYHNPIDGGQAAVGVRERTKPMGCASVNWREADRIFNSLIIDDKVLVIDRQVTINLELDSPLRTEDWWNHETLIKSLMELGFWDDRYPMWIV